MIVNNYDDYVSMMVAFEKALRKGKSRNVIENKIINLLNEYKVNLQNAQILQDTIDSPTVSSIMIEDKVQTSYSNNAEDVILDKMIKELELKDLLDTIDITADIISSINCSKIRHLIWERYVCGKSWEKFDKCYPHDTPEQLEVIEREGINIMINYVLNRISDDEEVKY